MRLFNFLRIHFLEGAVVGQVAVDLDLHVGGLGVDRHRQSLWNQRGKLLVEQGEVGVRERITRFVEAIAELLLLVPGMTGQQQAVPAEL